MVKALIQISIYRPCNGDRDDKLQSSLCPNRIEPPRGKTNNVVSEQVRHKPNCKVTEKS